MLSRAKLIFKLRMTDSFTCKLKESTDAQSYTNVFFNEEVQRLLRKLTNADLEKIFKSRPLGVPLKAPKYKFLTTEEVEMEHERIWQKANHLLQIPPYLEPRTEINEVLSDDRDLDGFDIHHSKFVFTDISFDIINENRIIVVREPNGILRKANYYERHRMNQIYFPIQGREIETPKMFEEKHLKDVLDREEYKFILDRACIQFEPNDPVFIHVTRKTYDVINERMHFQKLLSTRHFGSLTFHLVVNKNIDNLLLDILQSERIDDAYSLIELYHLVHPDCKSAQNNNTALEKLENYIKLDSKNQGTLELTLQTVLAKRETKRKASAV